MSSTFEMMVQLLFAFFLGAALGLEREWQSKPAGLRTYALVALGSCLFTIISTEGFRQYVGSGTLNDVARVASQIVVGIGFIGGGAIFLKHDNVQGLTTAAGLWIAAAIGMAVAVRFYALAFFAMVLSLIIFHVLAWIERNLTRTKPEE